MSIDDRIWSVWADEFREESEIHAVLVGPTPIAEVRAAYQAVRTPALPRVTCFSPTPWGVCLTLADGEDLRGLLEPLMARLDGELRYYAPTAPKLPDQPVWEGRMALRPAPDQPDDAPDWRIAPGTIHSVLSAGVTWAMALAGKAYGYTGVWWRAPDPAIALHVLRQAEPGTGVRLAVTLKKQFRQMLVEPAMGFASFGASDDEQAIVDAMTAVEAPFASVRQIGHPGLLAVNWLKNLHPERTDPEVWLLRRPGQQHAGDWPGSAVER